MDGEHTVEHLPQDEILSGKNMLNKIHAVPWSTVYFYGKYANAWRDPNNNYDNQLTGGFSGFAFKLGDRLDEKEEIDGRKLGQVVVHCEPVGQVLTNDILRKHKYDRYTHTSDFLILSTTISNEARKHLKVGADTNVSALRYQTWHMEPTRGYASSNATFYLPADLATSIFDQAHTNPDTVNDLWQQLWLKEAGMNDYEEFIQATGYNRHPVTQLELIQYQEDMDDKGFGNKVIAKLSEPVINKR